MSSRVGRSGKSLFRHPGWPYWAPFGTYLLFLALDSRFPFGPEVAYPLRIAAVTAVLLIFSRGVMNLRVSHAAGSVALGVAVFVVWIAPDLLWPGYRDHWLFQNALMGTAGSSIPSIVRADLWFVAIRLAGSALLVPVIEEVFWRSWLMRYIVSRDFESVPLGAYTPQAFWICALLFASEHGPYWDVGLLAGIAYNWWIVRTRNLGNCILAHAVTNACLGAYVLAADKWEYWL